MDTVTTALGMNELASEIADRLAEQEDRYRVRLTTLGSGARVIDAGVETAGGLDAGLALAQICMGGLGQRRVHPAHDRRQTRPGVTVWTDHPAVSCMASQYAGWAISVGKYFAMGSGPLRAHARVEHELFEKLGYEEEAERGDPGAGDSDPPDRRGRRVRGPEGAASEPSALTFVVAPTASLAGGVQISARIIETGLHKMETLGFDVRRVVSAMGMAPIPPVAKNDLRAIGRTNDCILYGGQAHYTIRAGDRSWPSWPRRCRRRPPATTARRSTTFSSGTRGTSTRSTLCSSARRRSG